MTNAGHFSTGIGWRHPHYAELLESAPALDFLEVHSENFFGQGGAALALLHQARARYPISLHGVGLALGSAAGVDPWHLDQLARLVERIEPVRVSDHACFARGVLGQSVVHAADLLPIAFHRRSLDVLCANVQQVQERLQRPLLVENLSAYVSFASSDMEEPAFLAELARRTGCGLLVDVNNLYVNALNECYAGSTVDPLHSCKNWLEQIPAHVVGELHLAGHQDCGDIVIDDHGSRVCEPVWEIYRHATNRFGRSAQGLATLVEWDTDVPPLQVLLDEASRARACQPSAEVAEAA
ncbi:MAG: DUF692 domain-containing protein [Polaromonas sp.]|uniref:MNIO family bufferin maturase n=1 Tax=Polaromonas sp. TaxID=1869339 RepID=UPI002731BDF2|nr:DUF692 domain-containing protein [Polaromonas sp.]MDP1742230.1 DUF692 domain-containing protein [Polaromonas sp.]MDP1952961.1 DUF692 domain-containing protein [Polaromonas sp.]MDP3357327.1 DUF692 domain-containing protein [Polaromonas sp.]MDP3751080.1 DUF692 domain-containing protein [Polaromonas sp.]